MYEKEDEKNEHIDYIIDGVYIVEAIRIYPLIQSGSKKECEQELDDYFDYLADCYEYNIIG